MYTYRAEGSFHNVVREKISKIVKYYVREYYAELSDCIVFCHGRTCEAREINEGRLHPPILYSYPYFVLLSDNVA